MPECLWRQNPAPEEMEFAESQKIEVPPSSDRHSDSPRESDCSLRRLRNHSSCRRLLASLLRWSLTGRRVWSRFVPAFVGKDSLAESLCNLAWSGRGQTSVHSPA